MEKGSQAQNLLEQPRRLDLRSALLGYQTQKMLEPDCPQVVPVLRLTLAATVESD